MALARGTSPAISSSAYQGAGASQAYTSPAFSPPAGSIIVVHTMGTQSYNNAWNAPTLTDSLATHLTWNLIRADANVTYGGTTSQVGLWWAYCPSAQTSMTVTQTLSVGGSGQTVTFSSILVDVWAGAQTTGPIGATASAYFAGTPVSQPLTPTAVGSVLCQVAAQTNAASTASTAGTGCFLVNSTATGTAFSRVWIGTSATSPTPTTSTAAQTLATANAKASPRFQALAYEVLAATGTSATAPGGPAGGSGRASNGSATGDANPTDSSGTGGSVAAGGAGSGSALQTGSTAFGAHDALAGQSAGSAVALGGVAAGTGPASAGAPQGTAVALGSPASSGSAAARGSATAGQSGTAYGTAAAGGGLSVARARVGLGNPAGRLGWRLIPRNDVRHGGRHRGPARSGRRRIRWRRVWVLAGRRHPRGTDGGQQRPGSRRDSRGHSRAARAARVELGPGDSRQHVDRAGRHGVRVGRVWQRRGERGCDRGDRHRGWVCRCRLGRGPAGVDSCHRPRRRWDRAGLVGSPRGQHEHRHRGRRVRVASDLELDVPARRGGGHGVCGGEHRIGVRPGAGRVGHRRNVRDRVRHARHLVERHRSRPPVGLSRRIRLTRDLRRPGELGRPVGARDRRR